MRSAALMGLLVFTAACATGGSGGSDRGMAYGVPAGGPFTYERGDSLAASITVPGMGGIDLAFDQSMTLGVTFDRSASGAVVSVEFMDFDATLANPIAGTSRASSSNVTGGLGFTIDATGRANLTDSPRVTGAAGQIFRPLGLANELLPRLPGRAVAMDDTWTDTIQYSESTAAGDLDVRWIVSYTVTGEVQQDGKGLTRVESEGVFSMSSAGEVQGTYVEQQLSGPEAGYFLWDSSRGVVVYSESIRNLEGTVDADGAPGTMQMAGRSVVKTTLRN